MQDYIDTKRTSALKCLGSIFTNWENTNKATGAISVLHSLRRNEHVTLISKKRKFDAASVSILSYGCEIWTVGYSLKKKPLNIEI
jgi:hypothetical protein